MLAVLVLGFATPALRAQVRDDAFVAGYVAAVLERELRIPQATVHVKDGVVTLAASELGDADRARVVAIVAAIPGVTRVEIAGGGAAGVAAPAPKAAPVAPAQDDATLGEVQQRSGSFLLKTPLLFEPLHADPRWPHFSAAYQSYQGNDGLSDVAAVSFGESFSFYRHAPGELGQWEIGLQAGVFAIFDLDADSKDLINADYFIGPVAAWKSGDWQVLARVYHQSSHLGDEFLLRTRINRVNLSYEVVDALVAWKPADPLRLYAGGGYLFAGEPELDPWLTQGGLELTGPLLLPGMRPVAATDVQSREQHDWNVDVSVRAGIQFEDPAEQSMKLQVLLEYYDGQSPNGQFLDQNVQYWGIGAHFWF
jgi:hypothetical protein